MNRGPLLSSLCTKKRYILCFILLLSLCLVARGVIPYLANVSTSGKPKPRGRAIVQCQAKVCKENIKKQGTECTLVKNVRVPVPAVTYFSPVPSAFPEFHAEIISTIPARAPPFRS